MANEKTIRTRIQNRHAPESYWVSNNTFVPRAGEIIIYDVDETHSHPRVKIGDGQTTIVNLPFGDATVLGETADTAYRGDRGKTAYDHAFAKGSAYSSGLYKVTTNEQGHVTNATPVVKKDITDLGVPAQDTTYNDATQTTHGLMSANDKKKLDNAKELQSAVSDPTASGTAVEFISGISQNDQGVISPSKKTVRTMGAASADAAGSTGLVPAPAKGKQAQFLRGDGEWETPTHQTIKQDGVTGATANRYATCTTAAGTAAKTATITTGTFTLETGATVYVKFTNSNTVALPTLNVNGTGAKSIMRYGTTHAGTVESTSWAAGAVVPFTYDGTYWIMQSGWDNNTTYSNESLGQGYGTCATEAATAAKVVALSHYALIKGGVVSVKFTNSVPASATMNINSHGAKAIFYKGAAITAGVIKAGDLATFIYDGTQYNLLSIDRWADDLSDQSRQIGVLADLDNYVTLEMYKSTSDGYWDNAMLSALEAGKPIVMTGTYIFSRGFDVPIGTSIIGLGATINSSDFGAANVTQNALGDNVTDDARIIFRLLGNNKVTGLKFNVSAVPIRCLGDNITITDCNITTHSSPQNVYDAYYAIDIKSATNIKISNIYISMDAEGWRDGIHINGSCHNIEISDSIIISGDDPIAFNAPEEVSGSIHDVNVSNCYLSGFGMRFYSKGESTKIYDINISNCQIYGEKFNGIAAAAVRFINGWGMVNDEGYVGKYENIHFANCTIKNNHSDYSSLYITDSDIYILDFVNCRINNVTVYRASKTDSLKISNSFTDTIDLSGITAASTIILFGNNCHYLNGASYLNMFIDSCNITSINIANNSSNSYLKIVNTSLADGRCQLYGDNEYIIMNCRFSGTVNPIDNKNGTFIVSGCTNLGGVNVLNALNLAKRFSGVAWSESNVPTNPVAGDEIFYGETGNKKIYVGSAWKTYALT